MSPGASLSGGGVDVALSEGVVVGVMAANSLGPLANPNPETAGAAATTAPLA